MSEWAWVALGYATTGGALAGYVAVMLGRAAAIRRRGGDTP
jgi:glutamate/tyrosine decarboxylase-like PLP-dependent enzyme